MNIPIICGETFFGDFMKSRDDFLLVEDVKEMSVDSMYPLAAAAVFLSIGMAASVLRQSSFLGRCTGKRHLEEL